MAAITESRIMGSSVASLALHVCAALLIPALAWMPSSAPPVETISFAHVTRIVILPKPKAVPEPRAQAPHQAKVVARSVATQLELAHVQSHKKASPPPLIAREVSAAPTVGQSQVGNGTAARVAETEPQASATPATRAVASVGGHDAGGYLPFGAEQPDPVLDPNVLKQLGALGIHVTLVVTVNENGKTETVSFEPPVDPKTEKQIESVLADAAWDPAVCGGGVSCEGHATIKL
ncbi:MAG TPA: hypothetical protein VFE36_11120 [Candidatus Baltobacteraceae bacterium]|jgi:hypothetical protein|nr:hypothetical protein [Candidatus Baltobacteraceae bacterium]